MKRYDFYMQETLMRKLKALSNKTGVSVSEMLRRMIKEYLKKNDKKVPDTQEDNSTV